MLSNTSLTAQITAIEIVNLQFTQQKLAVRIVEIEQYITTEYLKLLDLTWALSAKPLKNYLSETLESY